MTLTFTAITTPVHGTYCNETNVIPGDMKTRSGKTAIVDVGPFSGLCPGQAVVVTQVMDNAALISTDKSTIPYTYTLEVDYTLEVENIGTADLVLAGFIDLLPVGFNFQKIIPGGDIADAPFNLHHVSTLDRQRVTWKFNPNIPIAPGTKQTLKFKAKANVGQGVYWVDLLADFETGTFDEKAYTWPTAVVSIKDVYDVTAVDSEGNVILLDLQVQVQGPDGLIASWNIN